MSSPASTVATGSPRPTPISFAAGSPCCLPIAAYDPGALRMACDLAAALQAPLVASTVSRLLVDLNRSLSSPQVWSDATRSLLPSHKQAIVSRHYAPYRRRLTGIVAAAVAAGQRVVHLSSHSFTPILDGQVRHADVGLLYDPARPGEVAAAARWQAAMAESAPALRVRRNYPYQWPERRTDVHPAPLLSARPVCRDRA
jgi:predicted N-formylglutamate amidohydrolase